MLCKTDLSFEQLIRVMWEETASFDRLTQRDTILDIADLAGSQEKSFSGFLTRYWAIRKHGTVMTRTSDDLEEWESKIVARYCITWFKDSGWIIEQF